MTDDYIDEHELDCCPKCDGEDTMKVIGHNDGNGYFDQQCTNCFAKFTYTQVWIRKEWS